MIFIFKIFSGELWYDRDSEKGVVGNQWYGLEEEELAFGSNMNCWDMGDCYVVGSYQKKKGDMELGPSLSWTGMADAVFMR